MSLVFENLVFENQAAFIAKVKAIAAKLGIDPNWLMLVFKFESGLNSHIQNPTTGATGLIQFMPFTALDLGTTTAALKAMSNVQQLDYVYQYYNKYRSKIISYIDLYMATFFPKAIGKDDSYVLRSDTLSADTIARANPVFNLNKDGGITVGEIKQVFTSRIPQDFLSVFNKQIDSVEKFSERNWVGIALTISIFALALWGMITYKSELVKTFKSVI